MGVFPFLFLVLLCLVFKYNNNNAKRAIHLDIVSSIASLWNPSYECRLAWCVSNIWKCWTFISSYALKVPTILREKKIEKKKSTEIEVLTFERKIASCGWTSRLQCLYTLYIEESLNGFQADCSYFGHAIQAKQHWNAEACSPFVVDFCFSFVTQNIASMRKYFPFIYSDTKQKENNHQVPDHHLYRKKRNGRQGRIGYIDEAIILKYQVLLLLQSNSQAFFHKNVETTNGRKRLRITNLRAKSEEKSRKTKRTTKKKIYKRKREAFCAC